jgi:hypothetical protein
MSHDFLFSGGVASCMAACVYWGLGPERPAEGDTLEFDIGLIAAFITFIALMVRLQPQLFF